MNIFKQYIPEHSVMAIIFFIIGFMGCVTAPPDKSTEWEKEYINLGKWSESELDSLIHESSKIQDISKRIDFLSSQFLNVEYKKSLLIGDLNTAEKFVINFSGVDCFTYLDYVEALRRSDSFSEFKKNLRKVRYQFGEIEFKKRNHFFINWREYNSDYIEDVTDKVGERKARNIIKRLNDRGNGKYFLPGIPPKVQEIRYIPFDSIDNIVLNNLKTGDYAGIYSKLKGLDVSHTGIIIKKDNITFLRHASYVIGKVADEDLKKYISEKNGLVVLRPKEKAEKEEFSWMLLKD